MSVASSRTLTNNEEYYREREREREREGIERLAEWLRQQRDMEREGFAG